MSKILSETPLDNGLIRYQYDGWYEDKGPRLEIPEPTQEEIEAKARQWRNKQLGATDIAATVSDYPNAEAILAYRVALRDWPATEQFPDNKPVLGEV